jgi:3-hydroxybutyryl-CoA dehydrogenase
VVPGSQTDPQYVETVYQLLRRLELEAVKLDRAAPGFIGNRLQFALLREACTSSTAALPAPGWWIR